MSRPQRYVGRIERYYVGPYPVEVEISKHDATGLIVVRHAGAHNSVEGISAMALNIDGTPVAIDGTLYTSVTHIEHMPREYKAGLINLVTDGIDDE